MAVRKLQGEIDRTLKKVDEGIDEFNAIWDKVYEAPNQNLKEKHEADLKKEIKKLQRYRDQIKTWASSSDVKDKGPLLDARRSIETQMERFKICEKETKTKAYSKEALQKNKAEDKMSTEKEEMKEWFDGVTGTLRKQLAVFEQKLEKYGSKKKKKRFDKEEFEALQENVDRHRWHLSKLDLAWQRLESDKITVDMCSEIKDSVEYFVESHAEPDFYPDEYMYEPIEEDASPEDFEKKPPSVQSDDSPPPSPKPAPVAEPPPPAEKEVPTKKKRGKKAVKKVATPAKGVGKVKATTKTPKPKVLKKSAADKANEGGEKSAASKKDDKKKKKAVATSKAAKRTVAATKATAPAAKTNFASLLKRNQQPAPTPQQQQQHAAGPPSNGGPGQVTTAAALLRQQSGPMVGPGGGPGQQPPMVSPYQKALGSPRVQPQQPLALNQHMQHQQQQQQQQQGQKQHLPPHQQQQQQQSIPQQQMPHSRQGVPQQGPSYAGVHQQNGVSQQQFPHPGQAQQHLPPHQQQQQQHAPHDDHMQQQQQHHPQQQPPQTAASIVARGNATSTSDGGDGSSIVSTPLSTAVRSMPGSPRPHQTQQQQQQQQQLQPQLGPTALSRSTSSASAGGDPSMQQQQPPRGGDMAAMQQKFAHAQQQRGSPSPMGMPMQQQQPPLSTQGVGVGVGVPGSLPNRDHQQHSQQQQQQAHQQQQQMAPQHRGVVPGGLSPHPNVGNGPFGGNIGVQRGGGGGGMVPGGEKPPLDSQLSQSNLRKFKLLEASSQTRPIARDSESRHRLYVARNPYDRTPPLKCFPSRPFCGVDDVEIFSKFDIDTLFFIFYFQQGSYQQYIAAKQLKKLSWRYHKKYLTWFQRHDDPTVTTDEFEQGTYVYFDYDSSWCQRVKTDFVFEYKYLEDDLR